MDTGRIEFVATDTADDPGLGETADQIDVGRAPRRVRRVGVLVVALVALVALLGVGLVWHAHRPGTPSPPAFADTFTGPYTGLRASPCLSVECRSDHAISPRLAAVIRHYVPRARPVSAYTVVRSGALWFREFRAVSGRVEVLVIIMRASPPGHEPVAGVTTGNGKHIGYMRLDTGDLSVRLQLSGPRSWTPPLLTLNALASDPRLALLS